MHLQLPLHAVFSPNKAALVPRGQLVSIVQVRYLNDAGKVMDRVKTVHLSTEMAVHYVYAGTRSNCMQIVQLH